MDLQYDGFKRIVQGMKNNGGFCNRSLIYNVQAAAELSGHRTPTSNVINGWAQTAAAEGIIKNEDRPLTYVRQSLSDGKHPDRIASEMQISEKDFVRTYWGLLQYNFRERKAAEEIMDKIYSGSITDRDLLFRYFKRLSRDFRLDGTSLKQICKHLSPEDWYFDQETNRVLPQSQSAF